MVRTVWQGGVAVKTISAHDIAGSRLGEYDGDTGVELGEYLWLGGEALLKYSFLDNPALSIA